MVVGRFRGNFTAPGMTFSELNGNLQIADLTSVAVDPTIRGSILRCGFRHRLGESRPGSAELASHRSKPTRLPLFRFPNASQVVAAAARRTLHQMRSLDFIASGRNRGVLVPELLDRRGGSFNQTNTSGLSSQDSAGREPVLAVNSKKAPSVNGQLFDELLFGTNQVYLSRTNGAVWDSISNRPLSNRGGTISALAFSPIDSEYLAGTNRGEVFIKRAGEAQFTDITNNLSTLLGTAPALDHQTASWWIRAATTSST